MSIVTLKRKSNAIHSNVSKNGFYLNGTLRNPPPTLIRTPNRTSMKGMDPRGYGSGSHCRVSGIYGRSCKKGYSVVIHTTDTICTPQTEVKKSTMNTRGQLSTRFSGIFYGAYPKSVASPPPSINASDVIQNNVIDTLKCELKNKPTQLFNCQITKPIQQKRNYSEYMQMLKQNCNNSTKPIKIWHTNLLI